MHVINLNHIFCYKLYNESSLKKSCEITHPLSEICFVVLKINRVRNNFYENLRGVILNNRFANHPVHRYNDINIYPTCKRSSMYRSVES